VMSFQIAMVIIIILMGVIALITYFIGRNVSYRVIKYIPAITPLFGTSFFCIKLNFILYHSHAFEGIYDVITIIFLSITFGISSLGAIIIDIVQRQKNIFHINSTIYSRLILSSALPRAMRKTRVNPTSHREQNSILHETTSPKKIYGFCT
jgi:hypothetical protein